MSGFGAQCRKRLEELRKAQQDIPKIIDEVAEVATIEAVRKARDNTPPNGNAPLAGTNMRTGAMAAAWEKDSITTPTHGKTVLVNSQLYASYGNDGHRVYLWDPYLSAQDLLDTWYYTKTYGLELKAITSRADCDKGSDGAAGQKNMQDWMREQARILEQGSNQYGINLEFRCQW